MSLSRAGQAPQSAGRFAAYAVNLTLAHLTRRAADGDILHGATEAAHGMPLEMGKHDHGIVIDQMAAHGHFREVQAAAHRERHIAFLIHDIHGAEIPAVDPERFTMRLRCVAIPPVQRIGFHDALSGTRDWKAFTMSRGRMFGPFLSPVCSLMAVLP